MISTASFQQSSSHARQSLRRAPQYSTARIPSPSYPGKKKSAPQRFHPQRNSGEIVLTFSATATARKKVRSKFCFSGLPAQDRSCQCFPDTRIFVFRPKRTPYPSPGADNSWAGWTQYMPNVHHVSVRYMIDDLEQETSI